MITYHDFSKKLRTFILHRIVQLTDPYGSLEIWMELCVQHTIQRNEYAKFRDYDAMIPYHDFSKKFRTFILLTDPYGSLEIWMELCVRHTIQRNEYSEFRDDDAITSLKSSGLLFWIEEDSLHIFMDGSKPGWNCECGHIIGICIAYMIWLPDHYRIF